MFLGRVYSAMDFKERVDGLLKIVLPLLVKSVLFVKQIVNFGIVVLKRIRMSPEIVSEGYLTFQT